MLKEIGSNEISRLKQTLKLPYIGESENLFQVYIHFQEDTYNQLFEQDSFIVNDCNYFAVKTLGEKCGWDSQQKQLYFPVVADYDIFAIVPLSSKNSLGKDNSHCSSSPLSLDSYDSSFTKLKDKNKLLEHLGTINKVENEVRIAINQSFGIPMVRHGFQINSLTKKVKATFYQELIEINAYSDKQLQVIPFDDVLKNKLAY